MRLYELGPVEGTKHERKRVGRGLGSGLGKTAGKGHKGQKARSGGAKGPAFEGGQTPLQRRLPKRGFNNIFKKEFTLVRLSDLDAFESGSVVSPDTLIEAGVIRGYKDGVKVLANGELTKSLTVKVHALSKSAVEKIEAAGGKVEVI
jgi:large subunit ribosomal protein L15